MAVFKTRQKAPYYNVCVHLAPAVDSCLATRMRLGTPACLMSCCTGGLGISLLSCLSGSTWTMAQLTEASSTRCSLNAVLNGGILGNLGYISHGDIGVLIVLWVKSLYYSVLCL